MTWLLALLGCSTTVYEGQLLDELSGQPIGDTRVIATAVEEDASLSCLRFAADTDKTGLFTLKGLCNGMVYRLSTNRPTLWLPEETQIPGSGATDRQVWRAWHLPEADGIYVLTEAGTLDTLRPGAQKQRTVIRGTERSFFYPSEIPPDRQIALIKSPRFLVLAGESFIENAVFSTLHEVPMPVKIGTREKPFTVSNILSVGVRFDSATSFEKVPSPPIDAAGVTEKELGGRTVRYLSAETGLEGRYALETGASEGLYFVDFGARPMLPPAAAPEKEETGEK